MSKEKLTIAVKNVNTGEIVNFTTSELLDDINRDRSQDWRDYNRKDISTLDGLKDALTMTEYELISRN